MRRRMSNCGHNLKIETLKPFSFSLERMYCSLTTKALAQRGPPILRLASSTQLSAFDSNKSQTRPFSAPVVLPKMMFDVHPIRRLMKVLLLIEHNEIM